MSLLDLPLLFYLIFQFAQLAYSCSLQYRKPTDRHEDGIEDTERNSLTVTG